MDSEFFDKFAKQVSAFTSRRSLVRGLAGTGAGAALASVLGDGLMPGESASAKSKKKRRKQRKRKKEKKKEKKQECNDKGKTCALPLNPCETVSCLDHKCVPSTQPDGFSCGNGQICQGGQCVAACGSGGSCTVGTTCCGNACVDTQTNASNCGSCGSACGNSQICQGGQCVAVCGNGPGCTGGTTCCANACVDTQTSVANCGSCGADCGNTADTCSGGTCQCGNEAPCANGFECNSGTCVCPDGETCTTTVSPSNLNEWVGYNDVNDTENNNLLSFVTGPGSPPDGVGSVQMTVVNDERHNVATYQFAGTPLADITSLKFTTYNPSANPNNAGRSGYLHFNVDFDESDTWQQRLVYVPNNNGTVQQDTWQEWDAIDDGDALWLWSNFNTDWPNDVIHGDVPKSWAEILADYPDIRIRVTDAFLGIRIGEPYPDGFTGNVGSLTFGTSSTTIFDFEPDS